MPPLKNLVNQRFGRIVAIQFAGMDRHGNVRWLCRCDCGKEKAILGYTLTNGATSSCGCLGEERRMATITIHGQSTRKRRSKTYVVWNHLIQRCCNPNNKAYNNYGGRGITVCKKWKEFGNFLEDMGDAPERCQIDRINNNKGYNKGNCRWVSSKINNRNRRNNRLITHKRTTQCLAAWAEETGLSCRVISWRLNYGWSTEQALTEPVGDRSCKGVS